jgi:hypothetical protein
MSRHKGSELLPIGNLVAMPSTLDGFGVDISSFSFELKPLMDRIAANPKHFTGFAPFHPVEFVRFEHFAPPVIVVGFRHQGPPSLR